MFYLYLKLSELSDPNCPDDFNFPALIELLLHDEEKNLIRSIFSIKWDAHTLLQWITDNSIFMIEEDFPLSNCNSRSIASGVDLFYESVDPDDFAQLDKMYEYRQRHGIRFGLRGVDVPDAYIGKFNGMYEISCYENGQEWFFSIDIKSFLADASALYAKVQRALK